VLVFDDIKLALTGDSAARDRIVDTAKSSKSLVDTFTQLAGGTRSDAQPEIKPSPAATFAQLSPSSFSMGAGVFALAFVVVLALLWRE
jgi:hypothetical protein